MPQVKAVIKAAIISLAPQQQRLPSIFSTINAPKVVSAGTGEQIRDKPNEWSRAPSSISNVWNIRPPL